MIVLVHTCAAPVLQGTVTCRVLGRLRQRHTYSGGEYVYLVVIACYIEVMTKSELPFW